MQHAFSREEFFTQMHTLFHAAPPLRYALELIDIQDRSNVHIKQFSVYFAGSAESYLQQGMYVLQHAQMEELSIFLVPLGSQNGRMVYEAAFANYVKQTQAASEI